MAQLGMVQRPARRCTRAPSCRAGIAKTGNGGHIQVDTTGMRLCLSQATTAQQTSLSSTIIAIIPAQTFYQYYAAFRSRSQPNLPPYVVLNTSAFVHYFTVKDYP
jgi:hypothetical protein